jgi:molybdopterin-synthase adenylyltransferase
MPSELAYRVDRLSRDHRATPLLGQTEVERSIDPGLTDDQRLRYSRQMRLPQVGEAGQRRLLASRALIIGVGGLGSPAAMYLAAAGVGHLVLSDFDRVEVSNLQRQIVHRAADLGRLKTESAKDTLLALNPEVQVTAIDWELDGEALDHEVRRADVVLDCSDNFPTRFTVNAACVRARRPLVTAAAIRMEGQVTTVLPWITDAPCYRCLYRDDSQDSAETCAAEGVLAPVVGILGCIQATEAVKVLLGLGETLCGHLVLLDGSAMEWRKLRLRKDPHCPVCGRPGAA